MAERGLAGQKGSIGDFKFRILEFGWRIDRAKGRKGSGVQGPYISEYRNEYRITSFECRSKEFCHYISLGITFQP